MSRPETALREMPLIRVLTPHHLAFALPSEGARYFLPRPLAWELSVAGKPIAKGQTDRVVTTIDGVIAGQEHLLQIEGQAPLRFTAPDCPGTADITQFGAVAETDCTEAIAHAIRVVPEGGTVIVPAGDWLTGPVFLRSGVTIHLQQGAVLRAQTDRRMIPILPARHDDGRMLGSWEGLPEACYASLITAIDARGIAITGSGTLDGGGAEGDWWSWPKETRDGARRPRTLFMTGCEDVTLSGVTIRNSPSWTVHPLCCKRLKAVALRIQNPPDSPNTDGFDPESCEDVLIDGVGISVGDDCIAIKAGKRGAKGEDDHLAPTRGITIRNCLLERGHGGVVLGSEMSGSISDVSVMHCDFRGTDRGLRVKTRRGRGGAVTGIHVSDCIMDRVDTAISINSFYFCDADGRSDFVQSRAKAPVTRLTPAISDITVDGLEIRNLRVAAAALFGLPESPIAGVELNDLQIAFDDSLEGDVPDMALGLPVLHHATLVAEFADARLNGANNALEHGGAAPC